MASFHAVHPLFRSITGDDPALELLKEYQQPYAFEAGIYLHSRRELYVTSLPLPDGAGSQRQYISKIRLADSPASSEVISTNGLDMANGGTNYRDGMIFCAQGSLENPSALFYMSAEPPHETRLLLKDFYGRPFNSLNDVVVHSDGSIWFTDPAYGYPEGYRPRPLLPNQVYRHDPESGSTRVVADGIAHPNGICFSPDEKIIYVTDTDQVWGDGTVDLSRAATIYAYDVAYYSGEPFLVNRRVFAMADDGFPDGIKCDTDGNVYSGCGDGLHVWSPGGVLLGKIKVPGGVANFCFGKRGEVFLLNSTKVWRAVLAPSVVGALLQL